jgi:2-haloacid dehalogenase
VKSSPSLSPHSPVFRDLITIEAVACYKPDPRVYQYLAEKVWKTAGGVTQEQAGSVWLVSGNPFDVVGARAAGLQAAWVDRAWGHHGIGGWNDRLGELVEGRGVGPTVVVKGVDEAVKTIQKWTEGHGGAGEGRREGGDGKVDAAIWPG